MALGPHLGHLGHTLGPTNGSRQQRELRLDSWGQTGTLAPSMRRKLALFAAISMAAGLSACTKIESRDLIREGNQLYTKAQYEAAIEKYNQSLEKEPDGVTVLWNRAMAAESIVLALKDETDEDKLARRKQFATLALSSLDEWNQKRDKVGLQDLPPECARPKRSAEGEDAVQDDNKDPDLEAYEQHRLALLGADSRCDDLVEHWRQMHMACPHNEDLYMTIAQTFEDVCGMPERTEEWYVKRTEDFPDSSKAWYSLATRRFYPLMPDPEAGLPYNGNLPAKERLAIADEVIGYLEKATAIDRKYRDPYVWRSMAYTQKSLARVFLVPPETPQDAIEAILARRDSMLAWRETKAVCDIEKIPDCPVEVDELSEPPAIKPGELFRDLEANPSSWKDQEINLWGKVIGESVKQVDSDGYQWEFDLAINHVPAAPVDPELDPAAAQPLADGADALGEAATQKIKRLVKVRYSFIKPEVAEGEKLPNIQAEIEAQLDVWKRLKSTSFAGFVSIDGGDVSLVSVQKQMLGCCPPAPLTPEEEKTDTERLEELRIEQANLDQGESKGSKGSKGKGR